MAIDPNSAVGQTQNIYNALAQYFSDMTNYQLNGGACPDFNTYITSISYTEIHRTTSMAQSGSSNYPNGAAIESIHHIASVLREFAIRTKSKADYYSDSITDMTNESNYYSTLKTYMVSTLSGSVTPGGSLQ
jgi:hypothetical protein